MIEIVITTFVTFFVIIDPIGLTPVFTALTTGMSKEKRRTVSIRACLLGFTILLVFGLSGDAVLNAVGISLPAFRISGGLLLFLIAVEMLFKKRNERRRKEVEHDNDPSVFPLAVPLIAGPGAIATMILLAGSNGNDYASTSIIIGIAGSVILTAFVLFQLGGLIERVLGATGIDVVTRLFGMLLAALAVQFVLDGIKNSGLIGG